MRTHLESHHPFSKCRSAIEIKKTIYRLHKSYHVCQINVNQFLWLKRYATPNIYPMIFGLDWICIPKLYRYAAHSEHCSDFLHLHEIVERLYFHWTVCLCVCECGRLSLWTKFQPNGWTDLDAVFAKWLLTALAQTLLKLVSLGQRSRSQLRNIHFTFIILC